MSLHALAFDVTNRDVKQPRGARVATQHPPDLTLDLTAIGLFLAALQACGQPCQILFDAFLEALVHGPFLFPTSVAAAYDKSLFALWTSAEPDLQTS